MSGAPRPAGPSRLVRLLIPALLVLIWVAIAGIGGPYFGKIGEVSSNDRTTFLPTTAESTRVQNLLTGFLGSDTIPAVVVVSKDGGLSKQDLANIAKAAETTTAGVKSGRSPVIPSEDGMAAQVFVPIASDADLAETVDALRTAYQGAVGEGVSVHVTGPAGLTADLADAFGGIDGLLLVVALLAVFIILVVVYRSPLLPVLVLLSAVSALCAAILVNWWLAKAGVVKINGQVQGILFILVIGAATDYCLLYVSRFREALREHRSVWRATTVAWRGSVEPILASGGTVIAGLLCLLLSQLASNKALGPVAAVGIGFAMLSALTFLPALLVLFGRAAFWPRRPLAGTANPEATESGLWGRVGRLVARRDRATWLIATGVLLVGCLGLIGLRANGVAQSEFVLGSSQARDGQAVLAKHFPGGSGSPAYVVVPSGSVATVGEAATKDAGVSSVVVTSKASPSGTSPLPGKPSATAPTEVDGAALLQVTLKDEADSAAAEDTITRLRSSLQAIDPAVLIGGTTATDLDTNHASEHDRNLIIPLVLLVITVILALLLRALVAPLVLLATTLLSFGTALGVSSWMFNHVLDFPGADPSVPLYGFVFLVALGIDYNIFLMTRVREEALQVGTRQGVVRGLALTGSVITSAGVVLAATFAALAVIPILFLAQLAFIVAFGVLLDTLVVRALLVPAVVHDLGRRTWWPAKLKD